MAKKSLVKGAAVLAVAGLLVKFLGAFFRIPLANLIGSVGMANYYPAYSLYSFLLVFATAGLPVAVSKMVAERYAVGQFREAERVFKLSRMLMFLIGAVSAFVLFFFADAVAELCNMPGSAPAMVATAPALLLVPLIAAYRGYFQGMQNMVPTAISQVVEQIFRVVFGLALAQILMQSAWIIADYTPEERGAAGGCFGASAGAVGGLLTVLLIYIMVRKRIKARIRSDRTPNQERRGAILKRIAIIAIPITIGATIMPIVGLVDAGVIVTRLMDSGWDKITAQSMQGQLTGFATPLIAFPQVLMQAIVVSLVPIVSAAHRTKDRKELHKNLSLGFRMAMILAMPCAAGLYVLAGPVMLMLYPTQKASAMSAAPCLQTLAVGFVFLAIVTTMTGALQGIGKQGIPVINLFIGVLVKFVLTWVLTAIPAINVVGAAIGTNASYAVAGVLNMIALKRFTGVNYQMKDTVVKPLISSAVMGLIVFGVYKGIFWMLGSNGFATILSILIGMLVYGLLILRTKVVSREDILSMPMGGKLAALCDKLKLW